MYLFLLIKLPSGAPLYRDIRDHWPATNQPHISTTLHSTLYTVQYLQRLFSRFNAHIYWRLFFPIKAWNHFYMGITNIPASIRWFFHFIHFFGIDPYLFFFVVSETKEGSTVIQSTTKTTEAFSCELEFHICESGISVRKGYNPWETRYTAWKPWCHESTSPIIHRCRSFHPTRTNRYSMLAELMSYNGFLSCLAAVD